MVSYSYIKPSSVLPLTRTFIIWFGLNLYISHQNVFVVFELNMTGSWGTLTLTSNFLGSDLLSTNVSSVFSYESHLLVRVLYKILTLPRTSEYLFLPVTKGTPLLQSHLPFVKTIPFPYSSNLLTKYLQCPGTYHLHPVKPLSELSVRFFKR